MMRTLQGLGLIILATSQLACSPAQKEPTLGFLGEGLFQAAPKTVSFEIKSFCSSGHSPTQFVDFFFANHSGRFHRGLLKPDSDKDGLVDELEVENNSRLRILPTNAQSVASPFSDLVVYLLGIVPNVQNRLRCTGPQDATDNDRDGLLLCEERLLQTDPLKFDTDGDSLPDSLELRCGLNPRDPADATLDTDMDGATNIQECKLNTPVDFDNSVQSVAQAAYQYRTELIETPSPCMKFIVQNVPVFPDAGLNRFSAMFTQRNAGTGQLELVSFQTNINPSVGGYPGANIVCDAVPGAPGTLNGICDVR